MAEKLSGGTTPLDRFADEIRTLHGAQIQQVGRAEGSKDGALLAILPQGKRIEDITPFIEKYAETPKRRTGVVTVGTEASLIAIVERFKSAETVLFASSDPKAPSITAIFDYHPAGPEHDKTQWLSHRAVYQFPLADEWKAWVAQDGVQMQQPDFAAFMEDRIADVIAVDASDEQLASFAAIVEGAYASPNALLALARGLQVNVSSTVKEAVTLATGEISIIYDEQHNDGSGRPIKVPSLFVIAIPVFRGGPPYRIPVRLRYRVREGRVTWHFQLANDEKVFEHAYDEVRTKVQEQTGVPLYVGKPEAPLVTL